MENGPPNTNHLTALLWRTSIWRRTTQSLMANRYNAFGLLDCALTCRREPIANLGNSILVFQLNQRELNQALYGPPAELAPSL